MEGRLCQGAVTRLDLLKEGGDREWDASTRGPDPFGMVQASTPIVPSLRPKKANPWQGVARPNGRLDDRRADQSVRCGPRLVCAPLGLAGLGASKTGEPLLAYVYGRGAGSPTPIHERSNFSSQRFWRCSMTKRKAKLYSS